MIHISAVLFSWMFSPFYALSDSTMWAETTRRTKPKAKRVLKEILFFLVFILNIKQLSTFSFVPDWRHGFKVHLIADFRKAKLGRKRIMKQVRERQCRNCCVVIN